MLPYVSVASLIALIAIIFPHRKPNTIAWLLMYSVIVLFVGLRFHVGMDWNNYLHMSRVVGSVSYLQSFQSAEPGYATLMWISTQLGLGVYGANFVGAMIFAAGLFRYASRCPLPWLALMTAIPMLTIVVGMSVNRQSIAIGILMWLVADWYRCGIKMRIALVVLASTFHSSAIFFVVFVAFAMEIKLWLKLLVGAVSGVIMIIFLQYSGAAEYYDNSYVSGQSDMTFAPGATLHVLFNGVPAISLLFGRRIYAKLLPTPPLGLQMACLALSLVPLAFFFSVASSRMTLYLFPVSMYVFSALPGALQSRAMRAAAVVAVSIFMVLVLMFWLSFANTSPAHKPYRNVLFVKSSDLEW
jgi:hypothetical protein